MEQVIKFKAKDGLLFNTEQDCLDHEFFCKMVNKIYDELRNADSEEIFNWIMNNTNGFKKELR